MKNVDMELLMGAIVAGNSDPLIAMPLFQLNDQVYDDTFFSFNLHSSPAGFDAFEIDEIVLFSHNKSLRSACPFKTGFDVELLYYTIPCLCRLRNPNAIIFAAAMSLVFLI